ncbi:hypothetical protein OSH23_26365, partial [Mycobacterium ulcerans]
DWVQWAARGVAQGRCHWSEAVATVGTAARERQADPAAPAAAAVRDCSGAAVSVGAAGRAAMVSWVARPR